MTGEAICAALSVAEASRGGTLSVRLTVQEHREAGLPGRTVTARLDRTVAQDIRESAAQMDACLKRNTTMSARESAGKRLYQVAFRNDVGRLWQHLRARACADRPLRVRFDVRPGWLRALPWELLRGGDDWVFLDRHMSAWRGPDPRPADSGADHGPLRVLIVVCNPMDYRVLADQELAAISSALAGQLGRCHVEILDGPSRPDLSSEIDRLRPHVLHFIGHGMPRPEGGGTELFFNWVPKVREPQAEPDYLADAHAGARSWGLASSDVKYLASWRPRLVIVNACRTASDPADPVGGFAHAFLDAGARAVVSMQSEIQSPSAVLFSAAFYAGLREFAPLDAIISSTRLRLYQDSGVTGDWVLPVLAAATDPAEVLRISFAPARLPISSVCTRREYGQLREFLDRSAERWKLLEALDPPPGQSTGRSVVVIGGQPVYEKQPGKTWLTYWGLFDCYLRGHRVTYVDLEKKFEHRVPGQQATRRVTNKEWLDVLRVIRDSCTDDKQLEPLQPSAFGEFNVSLNRLVKKMVPESMSAAIPGPQEDSWERFDEDGGKAEERIRRICAEFLVALRKASEGRPHAIALDNANNIVLNAEDPSREVIYSELIRPIAMDRNSLIRLIIAAPDEWLGRLLPDDESESWTRLRIDGFDPAQFMRLARDYCLRSGDPFDRAKKLFEAAEETWGNAPVIPVQIFEETIRPHRQRLRAG